jgi:tRNA (guanine6-N2)-methyltransferase
MESMLYKTTYIQGLSDFVTTELKSISGLNIHSVGVAEIYFTVSGSIDFSAFQSLKTITSVYGVVRDPKYNPTYISNHKSILGSLVEVVITHSTDTFKTFKISCAGSDSPEVQEIGKYIEEHFKLRPATDADLEIAIGKVSGDWELSVRITSRPLSVRSYRTAHIPGGMNPTVAYALNSLCNLDKACSYLNICSGSGTLLIEAGLAYPELRLVGFDINGKHNALAIQNIKQAGLIKRIQLKTADLFDTPDLGKFDVVVADLPFGMQIGKDSDLRLLYTTLVRYCEKVLVGGGRLALYTTEHALLRDILKQSKFSIICTVDLIIISSIDSYLYPQILVCEKQ